MIEIDFSDLCRVYRNISRYTRVVDSSQIWPSPDGHLFFVSYCNDDLFMSNPYYPTSFVSRPTRIKDVLNLPTSLVDQDKKIVHHTARPRSFLWDGREDQSSYGSLLTGLSRLMTHGSNGISRDSVIRREKGVSHAAYHGRLSTDSLLPLYHRHNLPDSGRYFDGFRYVAGSGGSELGYSVSGARVSTSSDSGEPDALGYSFEFLNYEDYPYVNSVQVGFEVFESILSIVNTIQTVHMGTWSRHDGDFKRTYTLLSDNSRMRKDGSFQIDVLYDFELEFFSVYRCSWRVNLNFFIEISKPYPVSVPFVDDATRAIDPRVFTVHDLSKVMPLVGSIDDPNYSCQPVVGSDFGIEFTGSPAFFSIPTQSSTNSVSAFGRFKNSYPTSVGISDLNRESYFKRRFQDDLQNLRPSSYLAASDALSKANTILDSNWLQNLQHLNDALSLLPDFKGLASILAKTSDGDLSVLPDIADYLSQVILKWNFQQKPLIRDGKQLVAKDLLASIKSLSQPRHLTVYGSYRYNFEPHECYIPGRQVLETRAKLRLSVDLSSLLTSMLVADSLGFLPKLSVLWSLVPFSFVVDWFTNMSERLKLVDNQIKFMGFNTHYCVYSYKIFHYPTVDDLSRCHLYDVNSEFSVPATLYGDADIDDPFSLSVYLRELSFNVPRLTDSRYDFLKRTNPPNNWTVGALLWQFI